MDLRLKDRVALVTGASKGIGKAIASGFAGEGVHVALVGRTADTLDAVADDIRRVHGVRALAIPADVRDGAEVARAVDRAVRELGTIHILVNNAGGPIKRQER